MQLKKIGRLINKGFHILIEDGPKALWKQLEERRRFQKSIVLKVSQPLIKQAYDTKNVKYYGKTISAITLENFLLNLNDPIELALSQDNFIDVIGGVQLTIGKQAQRSIADHKNFLHIFPYWARKTLDFSNGPAFYGISLNQKLLGYVEEKALTSVLDKVLPGKLCCIHIHHAMAFRLSFLDHILNLAASKETFFWIHDFFTLCPNYFLLRNGQSFCNAPALDSNACTICSYGSIRPKHLNGFVSLFEKHQICVIAPSRFALDFWQEKFPIKGIRGEVRPHGKMEWRAPKRKRNEQEPLKIAFLGFPVFHKGWQTWLKLTEHFKSDGRYQFFLLSNQHQSSSNYKTISVTVDAKHPKAMVEALQNNKIDVAFLWSICPETYSYTLQEAFEAGAFVITNPYSGNIQKQVSIHSYGKVLKDEEDLIAFFETGDVLDSLIKPNN